MSDIHARAMVLTCRRALGTIRSRRYAGWVRAVPTQRWRALGWKLFTHACAERGPLEAAPGKTKIENWKLKLRPSSD